MKGTCKLFVDTTFRANSKMGARFKVLLPVLLFGLSFAPLFAAELRKKPFVPEGAIKARPTHAQLTEKRKDVKTVGKIRVAEEPIKMKALSSDKTESLVKRSAILSYGRNGTLVPRGAILHVPAHLRGRVNAERKGKLITWSDFYARNGGWLETQTVSLSQARGETAIAEDAVKVYKSRAGSSRRLPEGTNIGGASQGGKRFGQGRKRESIRQGRKFRPRTQVAPSLNLESSWWILPAWSRRFCS